MKQQVFEQRKTALENRISAAWKAMHHNASIRSNYPDFRNEFESDQFAEWLSMALCHECDRLEDVIERKFHITTKLYTAGRQGATVYPEVFHRSVGGNGFGSFIWDYFHKRYESDRDELRDMERVAKFLEWFNAHWKRQVSNVQKEWRRYKRLTGMSREIRAYDGLTKKSITVWA